MAALQGIAETYAGKNMTAQMKKDSIESLVKSKAMYSDFDVRNSPAIIRDALERLGVDISNLLIDEARPNDPNYATIKAKATASIISVHFLSDEVGTHYQEGDAKGRFRWDPISGASDGGRKPKGDNLTRYFWIRSRNEENE